MFALGLRYLNGWSMAAADGARKEQAEWPPHPDRVFMALAAAWFETGEDAAEGEALRWLEALPPPAIAASDASCRTAVASYVPVNDAGAPRREVPTLDDLNKIETFKKKQGKLKESGLSMLPEHRSRQPRGFPVAIPHDPTVHLLWPEAEPSAHRHALERLAAKVTHVGHSASFVQAWVALCPPEPIWIPDDSIAARRLRVTNPGRLRALKTRMNRTALLAYRDLRGEIEQAKAALKTMKSPPRVAWQGFPDVVLLAREPEVMQHPKYPAAKAGDAEAAAMLVDDLVDDAGIATVRALIETMSESGAPVLASAHAYERQGVNAIPAALAELLSERLDIDFGATVVQSNVVSHTGADGYGRLARQAHFAGDVEEDRECVMVDDFVGQGGTLANLRGHLEKHGGQVIGAVVLTGKPYSAKLNPTEEQLHEIREKHGRDFERWWREHFGHPFDCLTQSEARYLARSPDVGTIRDRLAAAQLAGSGERHPRSPREQRRHVKKLKADLEQCFPDGEPATLRPVPGRWQGYGRPTRSAPVKKTGSVFDPALIILGIQGRRVSLPATLRLTAALRGALMKSCPEQPTPEWFSGHKPGGGATAEPHLALFPLPFVGDRHADGRIMGLALALPRGVDGSAASRCLEAFLFDAHGLPRPHRLFDGRWFACTVEMENRERPPKNLAAATWTRPSRVWASVTPVVLNRHFDGKDRWERAAESVKEACQHIGLPRPREVLLHPVSLVEGAPHAREFPPLTRKGDGGRQSHSHAVLVFDTPAAGPVFIGAGRFRGYGLCRPMDETGDGH